MEATQIHTAISNACRRQVKQPHRDRTMCQALFAPHFDFVCPVNPVGWPVCAAWPIQLGHHGCTVSVRLSAATTSVRDAGVGALGVVWPATVGTPKASADPMLTGATDTAPVVIAGLPNASAVGMPAGAIVPASPTATVPNVSPEGMPEGSTSTLPGVTVAVPKASAESTPAGARACRSAA